MSNVKPDWYYGVNTRISMDFEFEEKFEDGPTSSDKWEDFDYNMFQMVQDLEGTTMLVDPDYYCRFTVVFSPSLSMPEVVELIDKITEFGESLGANRVEVGSGCV